MMPNGIWRARIFCEIPIASASEARAAPRKRFNTQTALMQNRLTIITTPCFWNNISEDASFAWISSMRLREMQQIHNELTSIQLMLHSGFQIAYPASFSLLPPFRLDIAESENQNGNFRIVS